MGMFKWPVRLETMDGQRSLELKATVDTGAAYTTVPGSLLREMGVEPRGFRHFELADGRRIKRAYGTVWATINGDTEATVVVFGADDGPTLLGAVTLESLSLGVDPVHRRLVPIALTL